MIPLVIAGSASGVGKTTVATGLMGALRRRGLDVAPFKSGPDYIDPSYHRAVTGAVSHNLDTWLTSPAAVKDIYRQGSAGAGVAVIEGAMGLFDGRSGAGDQCSTAEVARQTGGAVILVVDCARLARSLAPVLAGFANFDATINIAGAILNNVGSQGHARALTEAAREAGMPVLGVLPRRDDISFKSRHLGLVPAAIRPCEARKRGSDQMQGAAAEQGAAPEQGAASRPGAAAGGNDELEEVLGRVIDHVSENVDIEAMLALTEADAESKDGSGEDSNAEARHREARPHTCAGAKGGARIAVALDEAFSFYYEASLATLEAAGAELIFFSPLRDESLPDCDGLYLGGGFPEMFAAGLEANASMRGSVAAAARDALPIYAECGGLVYLCQEVQIDRVSHRLTGVLPLKARMTGRRQALGYVEATARRDNLLLAGGERVRGHEFHWSAIDWRDDALAYDCFSARESGGKAEGFSAGNILASYVHLHFAGNRRAAERFVGSCAGVKGVSSHVRA